VKKDNTAPKHGSKTASLRVISGGREDMGDPALDKLIHERKRLAIVSALAVNEVMSFNELKDLLDMSDGNLSVHAQKLETAGYIDCIKGFEGRIPKTEFRLTKAGQAALERYLNHMESLIDAVRRK
jgi:DNA-binding MarR family transcriptional regulator